MDAAEFKATVLPYSRKMWAVALTMLRDEADVRDAIQDTMEHLWINKERLAEAHSPEGYCITTLKRCCIDILRKASRIPSAPLEVLPELTDNLMASSSSESAEALKLLHKIVDNLPANQRLVIILYAYRSLSTAEIVEVTGFSPENVRQLLSRARANIKKSTYYETI